MYIVNGSDGRCVVAVRLIAGVRYLERPLREVLLYYYNFKPVRTCLDTRNNLIWLSLYSCWGDH